MRLSESELQLLSHLATPQKIRPLATLLNKSLPQLYRIAHALADKQLIERSRGMLLPAKGTVPSLFIRVLCANPNLTSFLADSGIPLLLAMPGAVDTLTKNTAFKRSMIYKKLKVATSMSIIKKEGEHYVFNNQLWNDLGLLIAEIRLQYAITDLRIPAGSIIYQKNKEEILYSTNSTCDAQKTAYSAYGQHGIKLLLPTHYYYLPKRKLSTREVFIHSLLIAAQEQSARLFLYSALYYAKHKGALRTIHHPVLDNIQRILRGEKLARYPTRAEIAERAILYDIRLPSNT